MGKSTRRINLTKRGKIMIAILVAAIIVFALIFAIHAASYNGISAAGADCSQYAATTATDDDTKDALSTEKDGSGLKAITHPHTSMKLTDCIAKATGMSDALKRKISSPGVDSAYDGKADWGKYHAEWHSIVDSVTPMKELPLVLTIERV